MVGKINQAFAESVALFFFLIIAIIGFKKPIWVAIGLTLHGLFDIFHHNIIDNDGTPIWWPSFCYSIDFTIAFLLIITFNNKQKT